MSEYRTALISMTRPAFLPTRYGLFVAFVLSSPWIYLVMPKPGRNSLTEDISILFAYLVGYVAFWLALLWFARLLLDLTPRRVDANHGRCFTIWFGVVTSLQFAWFLKLRPHPATEPSELVIATLYLAFFAMLFLSFAVCRYFTVVVPRLPEVNRLLILLTAAGTHSLIVVTFILPRVLLPARSDMRPVVPVHADEVVTTRPSMTLIGIDGLDWETWNRLVKDGTLSNFRHLQESGATGSLATFSGESPLVWTSIATGVSPEAHGIDDYWSPYLRQTEITLPNNRFDFLGKVFGRVVPYRDFRPVSSNKRTANALWEVLTFLDRKSLVVNWWGTYPADPIKGVMVSDYALPGASLSNEELKKITRFKHIVWPHSQQEKAYQTLRKSLGGREASIVGLGSEAALARGDFFVLRDELAFGLWASLSDDSFELRMLYLNQVDTVSHVFSSEVFGSNVNEIRPAKIAEEQVSALWSDLVIASYIRVDAIVGEIARGLSGNDVLIIVSDHGWRYDGTTHWRLPNGVVVLYGPQIKTGYRIKNAHVYDVFPTAAYLLDVPLSRELEGEILWEALEGEFVKHDMTPSFVNSYGSRGGRVFSDASMLDEDHLERLRSLGYIE